ncbi:A/G-specific adenine glycosylase [Acetobacteraceae bacterium ESL0709]|nr:A/G-specific adenine glycosylase [Acetobacteraceae bacterium ESL0697]MDF7677160.1 A/G-specific adenine glycosylase [Acetobacteraceae bacterium ESL0709]
MLQQTVVATVIPYYTRFLAAYPTLHDLAEAPLDEVLRLWAGLGYYARARNLHKCAQIVSAAGSFPETLPELMKLPGIGTYTASALSAIAFSRPVVPVDGNVERIIARLKAIDAPLPQSRLLLHQQASLLNHSPSAQERPSDFAQALFDLGATICTPRTPSCLLCPCQKSCKAFSLDIAGELPRRLVRPKKPVRYGTVFRVRLPDGQILLRTRPSQGLLGGTDELPGTPWRETPWESKEALAFAPLSTEWREVGNVRHIFSHFSLILKIYENTAKLYAKDVIAELDCSFRSPEQSALSSVMRKCVYLAERPISSNGKE